MFFDVCIRRYPISPHFSPHSSRKQEISFIPIWISARYPMAKSRIHAEFRRRGCRIEEHRTSTVPRQDSPERTASGGQYKPGTCCATRAAPKRTASARRVCPLPASMRQTTGSPSSGRTARNKVRSTASRESPIYVSRAGFSVGEPCATHRALARLEAGQPRTGTVEGSAKMGA